MWDQHRPRYVDAAGQKPHRWGKEKEGGVWDSRRPPFEKKKKWRQRVGFTLPPFKTERNKGRRVACTPPPFETERNGATYAAPFETERNGGDVWHAQRPRSKRKDMGRHTPPPFETKKERGDIRPPPVRNKKKRGDIRRPRSKQKRNGATYAAPIRNGKESGATCGMHAAPVRNKKKRGQRESRCPLLERISPQTTGGDKKNQNGAACGVHTARSRPPFHFLPPSPSSSLPQPS